MLPGNFYCYCAPLCAFLWHKGIAVRFRLLFRMSFVEMRRFQAIDNILPCNREVLPV